MIFFTASKCFDTAFDLARGEVDDDRLPSEMYAEGADQRDDVKAARTTHAWIVTSGTSSGVMASSPTTHITPKSHFLISPDRWMKPLMAWRRARVVCAVGAGAHLFACFAN